MKYDSQIAGTTSSSISSEKSPNTVHCQPAAQPALLCSFEAFLNDPLSDKHTKQRCRFDARPVPACCSSTLLRLLTAKSQDILNGHGSQKVKGRHMMNEAPLV